MSPNPDKPAYSPAIQSLLPMLYVAWADRVLSPTEAGLLRLKLKELDFLSENDTKILASWTDPGNPPDRELFQHWRILIHRALQKSSVEERKTLVDIGLEMASAYGRSDSGQWTGQTRTRNALEELEKGLEAIDIKTYQSLFPHEKEEPGQGKIPQHGLTKILDDDYHELRNRMRILLSDPAFEYQNFRSKETYRDQVLNWCTLLAKQGLGALSYPEFAGGKNDMGQYAAVFEMLGYFDLSLTVKFGVQFGLFGGSIMWLGTEKHHKKYLEDAGSLKLPGCFAMTETGHGSNVRGLETTATYDAKTKELVIHSPHIKAGKEYIGNALQGRMATVFAQLIVDEKNRGVHAILVPMRDENYKLLPGIRVEDNGYKMGLNGVDNGRIWFDQVRVPVENLLNRFGDIDQQGKYSSPIENPSRRFFTMLGTLVGGRVCVPRAGLSAAKSGLTIAIRYALKRRQFGADYASAETLILDYPSHQRRLMPLLAKAYALDFGLTWLTKRYLNRSEEDIREIETIAAGMKSYATWFTTDCLQECREACGGKGYLWENRFAALKNDTDIFTTFEGDNTVLMQLVAKGLLSAFRQEFHEEGMIGVLRYLGKRVSTNISERNPIIIRNTDPDHLRDSDFHLSAFRYREERLLYSVSQRLRTKIKSGVKAYEAALQCQHHLLQLAEAHVERLVLEAFLKGVKSSSDPKLEHMLKKLCNLYALHTIETHKGWYLEANYIESNKSKAIRTMVTQLCGEVRQDARELVDAFAIPEKLLGAKIIRKE
ncbi:MAG: acyl-CoA oxidase [Bacteroidetes bacterium]|nr:acyl-CoA oxidase [Bacteroidota bacterium]